MVLTLEDRIDGAEEAYTAEEIVAKLRQVDVLIAQGRQVADAVRSIGVWGLLVLVVVKRNRSRGCLRSVRSVVEGPRGAGNAVSDYSDG